MAIVRNESVGGIVLMECEMFCSRGKKHLNTFLQVLFIFKLVSDFVCTGICRSQVYVHVCTCTDTHEEKRHVVDLGIFPGISATPSSLLNRRLYLGI